MKNQYVADINDYRKYGLIRVLSDNGRIRTGVCWMLTLDDDRTDGKFIDYLDKPDKWEVYDPMLFRQLYDCIQSGERNVKRIETQGIIESAVYHSDFLSDVAEERQRYFSDMSGQFRDTDLVFFDPDNGLEVKSRPYGRKHSAKFLYWSELAEVYSTGKSVLVYQHFRREKREQFIRRLSEELCARLSASDVLSFLTPYVAFFLVPQPAQADYFKERAGIVGEQWRDQIKTTYGAWH